MKQKIDWKKVWKAFDAWMEGRRKPNCEKCGQTRYNYREWDEQQAKIQRFVNAQLGSK